MAVLSVRARALLRRRLLQLLAAGSGLLLLAAIRWLRAVKARAQRHARYLQLTQPAVVRLPALAHDQAQPSVVVLGGGISGLAAAWHVKNLAPECRVVVVEAAAALGGNIATVELPLSNGGCRIETGPRSLRTTTASAKVALQVGGLLPRPPHHPSPPSSSSSCSPPPHPPHAHLVLTSPSPSPLSTFLILVLVFLLPSPALNRSWFPPSRPPALVKVICLLGLKHKLTYAARATRSRR